MDWEGFLKITGEFSVIDTENLFTGSSDLFSISVQISRWVKTGKLIQLKRGIYLLADPYRKVDIYEPHIAAILKRPSYISLEKALEYHNLIPEAVTVYTSITTKRNARFSSKAGTFDYRHIKDTLFWGYSSLTMNKQTGFMASPEKALLDFFYLNHADTSLEYLEELRLQNVEKIHIKKLQEYAQRFAKPKMVRVAQIVKEYAAVSTKGVKVV